MDEVLHESQMMEIPYQYRLSTPSSRKQEVLAVAGSPLAYDEGGLSLRAYKELSKLSRHWQRKTLALSSRQRAGAKPSSSFLQSSVSTKAAPHRSGSRSPQDYRLDPLEGSPPLVGEPSVSASASHSNTRFCFPREMGAAPLTWLTTCWTLGIT
jgi:hypothetical protein